MKLADDPEQRRPEFSSGHQDLVRPCELYGRPLCRKFSNAARSSPWREVLPGELLRRTAERLLAGMPVSGFAYRSQVSSALRYFNEFAVAKTDGQQLSNGSC
jgi:hypothetical protein